MTDRLHTPGPWTYKPTKYDDWGTVKAGKFSICQARDPRAMGDGILADHRHAGTDPWEANARLISAAPDLLEALEPFAAMLKPHHGDLDDERPIMGIEDAVFTVGDLRKARAAIDKATGGDA